VDIAFMDCSFYPFEIIELGDRICMDCEIYLAGYRVLYLVADWLDRQLGSDCDKDRLGLI